MGNPAGYREMILLTWNTFFLTSFCFFFGTNANYGEDFLLIGWQIFE